MDANAIIGAVNSVTSKWAKQRRAEERHARAKSRRRYVMTSYRETPIKDYVFKHMEAAYDFVSNYGQYPAAARQMYYRVRKLIQADTDKELESKYFTQTLLREYQRLHGKQDWNVVFDARGHFDEPHTKTPTLGLGTIDVRNYLNRGAKSKLVGYDPELLFPTHGPKNRLMNDLDDQADALEVAR